MKFVIATGGSGGHFFPALMVADELYAQAHEVTFVGSFNRGMFLMRDCPYEFRDIGAKGLPQSMGIKALKSMALMIRAIWRSLLILWAVKPDRVFGFGGYGAFPVVCAATILRIPTIIHEQNVVPGRANALLSKFVGKVAVSFDQSIRHFKSKRVVLTGCPCRAVNRLFDRETVLESFGLKEHRMTLLVFGGSQGSQRINHVFLSALKQVIDKRDVQVIHITGRHGYQALLNAYNQFGIPFALFEFLDKMEEAYFISDLVIARAGARTVCEIAGFQVPAILLPYPGAGKHQSANASVFQGSSAVRTIEDGDLNVESLVRAVLELCDGSQDVRSQIENFKGIYISDAAKRLADEAVKLA